jgi:uncharacterized protein (DUF305 family)
MSFSSATHGWLRAWMVAAALGLAALLGSCAESAGSAGAGSQTFNDADVKFAQTMIPHHEQAIEMADAIMAKPGALPDITQVAQQIKDTQAPQVETMQGFLAAWEQPLIPDHSSEADEHHWAAEGVLTPEEMQALGAADTADGQRLFLEGMIEHHKGAVVMVQEEIDDGENPDAVNLAQAIKDGQSAEIRTMESLLARL